MMLTDAEYRLKLARLEFQQLIIEVEEVFVELKALGKLDPTFPARLLRIRKALATVENTPVRDEIPQIPQKK